MDCFKGGQTTSCHLCQEGWQFFLPVRWSAAIYCQRFFGWGWGLLKRWGCGNLICGFGKVGPLFVGDG